MLYYQTTLDPDHHMGHCFTKKKKKKMSSIFQSPDAAVTSFPLPCWQQGQTAPLIQSTAASLKENKNSGAS